MVKSPSSKVPWKHRIEDELTAVCRTVKSERRKFRVTMKCLEERIKANEMEMAMTEELLDYLNEALDHAQNHLDKLCSDIKPVLLEVIKEEAQSARTKDGNSCITDEETEQLVEYVAESIKKITLKKSARKIESDSLQSILISRSICIRTVTG